MINAIVAVDLKWGIGSKGNLLVSIPEDLKRFKDLTINKIVIMGRKTWDSLPKKPLPNRKNIIITNSPKENTDNIIYMSMEEVKKFLNSSKDDIFIIGGGTIYSELLPYCDGAYITHIYRIYDNVDTYFPNLLEMKEWKIDKEDDFLSIYKDTSYSFKHYSRI